MERLKDCFGNLTNDNIKRIDDFHFEIINTCWNLKFVDPHFILQHKNYVDNNISYNYAIYDLRTLGEALSVMYNAYRKLK